MKKLVLAFLLTTVPFFGQSSDRRIPGSNGFVALTATCSNANTTCDTATTVFGPNGDVIGPQTVEVNTQGYGLAVVYVSGTSTASGATINFEFSDDGGSSWYSNICTRSDANIQEANEVVPTTTYRAWDCGVGAATRMRVRQSAITSGTLNLAITLTAGLVEPAPTVAIANTPGVTDPCANASVLKSSVAINATANVQLVALSGTTIVYVCGFSFTVAGSATATAQLEYGTGAVCATGPVVLTGSYLGGTLPVLITGNSPGTVTKGIAANALCLVAGGATPSIQGVLTFVQQ